MAKCAIHPQTEMIEFCPSCRGSIKSKRKAESSKRNGKLGGRPSRKKRKQAGS